MSHIPASKMPHATSHDEDDTGAGEQDTGAGTGGAADSLASMPAQSNDTVFAGSAPASDTGPATTTAATPPAATSGLTYEDKPSDATDSVLPIAALAIGGLVAIGAIAAAVLPLLTEQKKPKKGAKKKKRAEA